MSAHNADSVRWCVKHREGWCAVWGGREPKEGETNVPTECGFFVISPFGYDLRTPDCPDCLAMLTPLQIDGEERSPTEIEEERLVAERWAEETAHIDGFR